MWSYGEAVVIKKKWQPILKSCPAPLPDQEGRRNTFFESILVAHQFLKQSPTVLEFLDYMISWAGRSPDKSDFYKQNILHSYYLVGLIPYTMLKQADYRLISELPIITTRPDIDKLLRLRTYCLVCFTKRLKYTTQFWEVMKIIEPFTQNQILENVSELGIKYKEVTKRVRIMINLDALAKNRSCYNLTPLGKQFVPNNITTIQYQQENFDEKIKESSIPYFDFDDFIDLW
jgi:hypothetical protein